ncbi:MAG: PDZ domain-containing protein [Planctomycetota bacterium]|nr:MAG: PDZ domain-containing protein [Planctomycetota bacterium]
MPANDQYWRDLGTMHKVFAASAFALFAATLLMMARDEKREWRDYQRQAEELKLQKLDSELKAVQTDQLKTQIETIEKQIQSLTTGDATTEIAKLTGEVDKLKGDVVRISTEAKFQNAKRDVARAEFDIAVRDAIPDNQLAKVKAKYDAEQLKSEEYARLVETVKTETTAKTESLTVLKKPVEDQIAELGKLKASQVAIQEQIELLKPSNKAVAFKRAFKEWPIINGFNPHLKIQYDWPRGLKQQLGMANVDRVDRCRSCHVNINDFAAGNVAGYPAGDGEHGTYAQPFSAHPNPDLFLTATSAHPIDKFGCTICHEGDGSGTSFQNAEHSPRNPAQAALWEENHHWHSNHFWEVPMYPKHLAEAACIRCHHGITELAHSDKHGNSAPQVVEGHRLISEYGCYGCHEVNGFDAGKPIGPDLRLEPGSEEQAAKIAADPTAVAGKMRKVGPSLRHIAQKSSSEFIAAWVKDPQAFRPTTKMPKFFGNTNQNDHLAEMLQPVELEATAAYLEQRSQPLTLLKPKDGYVVNPERGKLLFSRRGCMACHSYDDAELKGVNADFGPDLSRIHEKIKPGVDGFLWMYTWLNEPSKYHTRTKMPNLFLKPEGEGEKYVDPAADIAAFLLAKGATEFPKFAQSTSVLGVVCDPEFTAEEAAALGADHVGVRVSEVLPGSAATRLENLDLAEKSLLVDDILVKLGSETIRSVDSLHEQVAQLHSGEKVTLTFIRNGATLTSEVQVSSPLDDLVRLYLKKALPSMAQVNETMQSGKYPVSADLVKGDEVELLFAPDQAFDAAEWQRKKQLYVGRKTIGRYGCYGCHDIPGFEEAGPIGVALQDWGRKDPAKLAPEHIAEYLHHHGEPDGSSTLARVEGAVERQKNDGDAKPEDLSAAFYINSLTHHGRPGFIWQKLRDPRSYDYKKIETKGWDERLRMPKFPFTEKQIESVATFVVGLVADPPAPAYQYKASGAKAARLEGERLLAKYNCGGCHVLEMPKFEFATSLENLQVPGLTPNNYPDSVQLLEKFVTPTVFDPHRVPKTKSGELILSVHGLVKQEPDLLESLEDQILYVTSWDVMKVGDKTLFPGDPVGIPVQKLISRGTGRGGEFAHWLVPQLMENLTNGIGDIAWQASPPPLVREGQKVQTPWLYQFLKDPQQIRHTTVLRMPKFNMDDSEAMVLANYFAAVDGAEFPYQTNERQSPDYLDRMEAAHKAAFPGAAEDRITAGWKMLSGGDCKKCHQVGGREYVLVDPTKDIRGPNLDQVEKRLRPDWVQLWVTNPKWVTPYTSMLQIYAADKPVYSQFFGGQGAPQIQATVDALMNYYKMLERHGKAVDLPPPPAAAAPPATN